MTIDAIQQIRSKRDFTTVPEATISGEDERRINSKMPYDAPVKQLSPGHSRNSSNTSTTSSSVTPSFSSRTHSRWPSSGSSYITTPDPPINVAKQALHDLIEEPAEKDDSNLANRQSVTDEQICICDTVFCRHQQTLLSRSDEIISFSRTASRPSNNQAVDDVFSDPFSTERRGSGGSSGGSLTTRVSQRWPSISKHFRDRRATSSVSDAKVRSAPPSRSSSSKTSGAKRNSPKNFESSLFVSTGATAALRSGEERGTLSASSWPNSPERGTFEDACKVQNDPIEREELSSTPLLPPLPAEFQIQNVEAPQSPLQSPSVATRSPTESFFSSPADTSVTSSMCSPSLSAKPSSTSLCAGMFKHGTHASVDITPLDLSRKPDKWEEQLGHSNFHILPEPYIPTICDAESCTRLLEDWKAAQVEYLRQAARIGEHHGPTSATYILARLKWDEIEAQWRSDFAEAKRKADEANGETLNLEPLEDIQAFAIPDKFPDIDDADIVGPMVQYAKVEPLPASKKPALLLRLCTWHASILRKTC